MSKASSMMRQIERRLSSRPPDGPPHIVMFWGDDDMVTDDNGDRVTAAEWSRRHPDARVIQMTWGDEHDEHSNAD